MNFDINFEIVEMDMLKLSCDNCASRIYDLNNWTIGAAVENYINDEVMA